MIRIQLTQRQRSQLSKHFDMVNAAYKVGQRGIFVAQVQRDWWNPSNAYVRAHFLPGNLSQPVADAVKNARLPNCFKGIPGSAFQPHAHTSGEPHG